MNLSNSLRTGRFDEMCQTEEPLDALAFLQTNLSELVDHSSELESAAFRQCISSLIAAPPRSRSRLDSDDDDSDDEVMNELKIVERVDPTSGRSQAFLQLISFFDEKATQPREKLIDLF